jgi:hypothetical protein
MIGSLLLLSLPASAGELFVNGLPTRSVKNLELHNATVRFDAAGDVHIAVPDYDVTELPSNEAPRVPRGEGVPYGGWWLVSEDRSSSGHTADVWIGGLKVGSIRSGAPPLMVDLAPHLWPGSNVITLRGRSGVNPSGTLAIYVGEARVEAGTLNLQEPAISIYCRTACPPLQQEVLDVASASTP